MTISKSDISKTLPKIDDSNLSAAVDLSLWLYLDKHYTFKGCINISAKKYAIKPKLKLEKLLRSIIPESVFYKRSKEATKRRPMGERNGLYAVAHKAERHIKDIVNN
ncbi:hypothetical protein C9J21_19940 [Photobacterium phosphoreum]|uniref:hypothetical protein n=1 Tax=Photobacterium phosphoreum TaxID=659 RepID=UPI000D15DCFA|nr:hypothetical protein [Photobacterium phosphoreum]PSW29160.1 hypothetical protein C9J21_19940 [Photobacterium phosphoreum]